MATLSCTACTPNERAMSGKAVAMMLPSSTSMNIAPVTRYITQRRRAPSSLPIPMFLYGKATPWQPRQAW